MDVAFFLFALPMCIADIHALVIPNIYNKILLYLTFINLALCGFGVFREILISLAILTVLLSWGTGIGDIKLLGLILLNHSSNAMGFIVFVLLIAMVHILVLASINRQIPSKIPLAPSIFMGLVTYLVAG